MRPYRESSCAMSRRRRCAREKTVRLRVARAKVLRRRARGAGTSRAATAAIAAAVTLVGVGASTARRDNRRRQGRESEERRSGAPVPTPCSAATRLTPPASPSYFTDVGGTLFFTADDGTHGGSCGSPTAPRRARSWSRTSTPDDGYYSEPVLPDRLWGTRCSSPPTTVPTAGSCGSRTAPGRAPSWSRTSTQATATASGPPT